MAKRAETSEAVIMVSFIVMNLERLLAQILLSVFRAYGFLWMVLPDLPRNAGGSEPWTPRLGIATAKAVAKPC